MAFTAPAEVREAALVELAQRGAALYDSTLMSRLEPAHNGEVVAIHPDTGDFALAQSGTLARRSLRARHPQGLIWTRTVGSETRRSLLRRVLGARALAQLTPDK